MTAETIAKTLGGRRTGGGWMARHPAHDDHRLRRKRASGRRPLGPGERAAARACHERGFRVIEGGRL